MRLAWTIAVAVLALIGIGAWLDGRDESSARASAAIADLQLGYGAPNFTALLAKADGDVAAKRSRLAAAPDEWLHEEVLARALMARHRIGGDFADLDEAQALVDSALARAPDPAGPTLTAARLALSRHRLVAAAAALDRFDRGVAPFPLDIAEAQALRGDIAFQRGDLAKATALFRQAHDKLRSTGTLLRVANAALWSGNAARAARMAEREFISTRPAPAEFAASALALANLSYAAGDLDRARQWVDAANEAFPGYWLGDAYAAQHAALAGDLDRAVSKLSALAAKESRPEVEDALTFYLRRAGRGAESRTHARRGAALWAERMTLAPETYRLHAAEHELVFGDPARALELLREEVAVRPHGPVFALLARALIIAGRPRAALTVLDQARQGGWRITSLELARADALFALGRADAARDAQQEAERLNPLALDERRSLIWFGHD